MEKELEKRVKGQESAISSICKVISQYLSLSPMFYSFFKQFDGQVVIEREKEGE